MRYALKTPYRDGTTHIVLEPLGLMARLAALVPPPRMQLTRSTMGVFAIETRALRRQSQDHRQHRGADGHREDSLAPGAHSA